MLLYVVTQRLLILCFELLMTCKIYIRNVPPTCILMYLSGNRKFIWSGLTIEMPILTEPNKENSQGVPYTNDIIFNHKSAKKVAQCNE